MQIVVGSTALKEFIPWREPKDLDIWCTSDDIPSYPCDYSVMPDEIMEVLNIYCIDINSKRYSLPIANYTIKVSHLGWDSGKNDHSPYGGSIQWDKHKADVLNLHTRGIVRLEKLYQLLIQHWKKEFGNKEFLSLNQSNKDFFNDHVNYVYDHDDLHKWVSGDLEPVYTKCLKPAEEVLISEGRFWGSMSQDERIRMFREEIAVIAIERYVIPSGTSFRLAWIMSLKKTITRLTKNWATEFIINNLEEFVKPQMGMYKNYLKNKETK